MSVVVCGGVHQISRVLHENVLRALASEYDCRCQQVQRFQIDSGLLHRRTAILAALESANRIAVRKSDFIATRSEFVV